MAGLIKAALALEHGIVPPTLHCEAPNPEIPFDDTQSAACAIELETDRGRAPAPASTRSVSAAPTAMPCSAAAAAAARQAKAAARKPRGCRRWSSRPAPRRRCASSRRRWRDKLADAAPHEAPAAAAQRRAPARPAPAAPRRARRRPGRNRRRARRFRRRGRHAGGRQPERRCAKAKLAFVFAGNGAQWAGMGRDAYTPSAAFRDAVGRGGRGACARRSAGRSASWSSAAPRPSSWRTPTSRSRCCSRSRSASSRCCASSGSRRPAHIGHSVGEIARGLGGRRTVVGPRRRGSSSRAAGSRSARAADGRMAALALGSAAAGELLAEIGSPLEAGRHQRQRNRSPLSGPERGDRAVGSRSAPARHGIPRPRSRFRVPFGGDGPDPRRPARRIWPDLTSRAAARPC